MSRAVYGMLNERTKARVCGGVLACARGETYSGARLPDHGRVERRVMSPSDRGAPRGE